MPQEPHRRWFADDAFDLIVWDGPDGDIIGFQLCYRDPGEEHALTWMRDRGFSHDGVDDGEGQVLGPKMTPVLIPDGRFDKDGILARFEERAARIDPAVAAFVVDVIGSYPGRDTGMPGPAVPTRPGPRPTVNAQRPSVRGPRPSTRGPRPTVKRTSVPAEKPIPTAKTIRRKSK